MKRRISLWLVILVLTSSASQADPPNSLDPLDAPWEQIVSRAAGEGRFLYVAFIGQGWSMASKRFQQHVLDSVEFQDFARKRLLYCPVKARVQPKLSKEQTARLQSLVIHFDIKQYPTLILLNPDGTEILRHGYREDSPADYVKMLQAILPPS